MSRDRIHNHSTIESPSDFTLELQENPLGQSVWGQYGRCCWLSGPNLWGFIALCEDV